MSRRTLALGIVLAATTVPMLAFGQFATSSEELLDTATTTEEAIFATTTEEMIATSTEEVIATSTAEVLDASTTPSVFDESVIVDTGIAQAQTVDKIAEETADATEIDKIIQSVADSQAAYFEKNGKYLQVMDNRRLPDYEDGNLTEKIGGVIPNNVTVNVYEGPTGKGFQIVFRNKHITKAVGYGPDAASFTYTVGTPTMLIATSSATSTVEVVTATSTESISTSTASTEIETPASTESETDSDRQDSANGGELPPVIDKKSEDPIDALDTDEGNDEPNGETETSTTTTE